MEEKPHKEAVRSSLRSKPVRGAGTPRGPKRNSSRRQAEQEAPLSQSSPTEFAKQQPEFAKQQSGQASRGDLALQPAEKAIADERHAQVRAIASDLLSWKGGLKVLKQAQLPKWRGYFKWQIEAKSEALQAAYAKVRAEAAKPDE